MSRRYLLCIVLAGALTTAHSEGLAADRLPDAIWGTYGSGPGQLSAPFGIAVDADGYVYVTEGGNNRISKFDSNGGFVMHWGSTGSGPGQFNVPHSVSVAPDGNIVVADTHNRRIQVFDNAGGFIRMFGQGSAGTDSTVGSPHRVAVDADGSIYVSGGLGNYVSKFTSTGIFTRRWYDQLSSPFGIASDGAGTLFVCSAANGSVVVSDTAGVFRYSFGQVGTGINDFSGNFGIAIRAGELVIADYNNNRIKVHAQDGQFISEWGRLGSLPGEFSGAQNVAVGPDGAIYVADTGNSRIQKFNDAPVNIEQATWGSVKARYR